MRIIISTAVLLSVTYLYLIYRVSPEWGTLFDFSDAMHLLKNQFIYLFVGFGILVFALKFKSPSLFNKIGLSVFILSIVMLVSMFFLPTSLVPQIDSKIIYIVLGGLHIYPILFFTFGMLWFINYLHISQNGKNFSLIIIGLMFLSGFFTLSFHDYGMFLLLEMVLISLLFYINGFSKYLIGSIIGVVVAIAAFIVTAPHRLSRLQSWLAHSDVVASQNNLDIDSLVLLTKYFGTISLVLIVVFFSFFIYQIVKKVSFDEKYKLFTIGIVASFAISLVLNLLNVFGLLPVASPPLYFFDYGLSITVISYLMIGMLDYSNVKKT